jgi:AraC-like DNA-binding protein
MIVAGMLAENVRYIGITLSDSFTPVFITAVCLILYVILVYIESWRTGQRDLNLVMYKHTEYNKYKPLLAALVSQLPGIILAVLVLLPSAGDSVVRYIRYFYLNFNWFYLTYAVNYKAVYFIPVIFPFIIAPIAYHLGYKDYRLLDKLMFVNPDKKNKTK